MKKLTLLLLSAIFATACAPTEVKPAEPIATETTVSQQPSTDKVIIPKDPNETYGYREDQVKKFEQLDASYTDGYDLEKKWILTYGFPPTPDPVAVKYESYGVELTGWIVEEDYFGERRSFFHLNDESMKKLPFKMKFQNFNLDYANTENVIAKLKTSSQSAPITITVDKLTMYMEGFDSLRLASPPL